MSLRNIKILPNELRKLVAGQVTMIPNCKIAENESLLPDFEEYSYNSMISFSGQFSGNFIFSAKIDAILFVAESIFGFPIETDDNEMIYETIKEFLNIITGPCKNFIFETGSEIEYSLPKILDKGVNFSKAEMEYDFQKFLFGNGEALFTVVIEKEEK